MENLIYFNQTIKNGLQQLNASVQVVGQFLHASSSKERFILKDGIRKVFYQQIEDLKSVQMAGQQMK